MELDKKLHKEIKEYCKLNNLTMTEYVNSLLKKAFMLDKYGDRPPFLQTQTTTETITTSKPKQIFKIGIDNIVSETSTTTENETISYTSKQEIAKPKKRTLKTLR